MAKLDQGESVPAGLTPNSEQVGLPTAAPIHSLTLNAVDAPTARLELYRVLVISPE